MEATKEDIGFLDDIRPPLLEDAGLEDCALPPDAIKEAFFKAATSVSSRVASVLSSGDADEADGECVNVPFPGETSPLPEDVLVGSETVGESSGPCAVVKGGESIGVGNRGADLVGNRGADLVGSGIQEEKEDVIVAPPGEVKEGSDGKPCVDGARGLKIKEKKVEGGEEEREGPILVEGYLV